MRDLDEVSSGLARMFNGQHNLVFHQSSLFVNTLLHRLILDHIIFYF